MLLTQTELKPLSKTEFNVLCALFELKQGTSARITEYLNLQKHISSKTVQTLLVRLVDKHWVSSEMHGRQKIYIPKPDKKVMLKSLLNDYCSFLTKDDAQFLINELSKMFSLKTFYK